MKPALSRFDRMDMLREAGESSWLRSFLENFQGKHTAASLLPIAREGIFFYLRERYAMTMREQGYTREEAEKALRDLANEAVIVKPRHRVGAHCIVGRWMLSELGDTHDGEYELAAG